MMVDTRSISSSVTLSALSGSMAMCRSTGISALSFVASHVSLNIMVFPLPIVSIVVTLYAQDVKYKLFRF